MNSRERVLAALRHEQPDRTPRDFWAEPPTMSRLFAHDDDRRGSRSSGPSGRQDHPQAVSCGYRRSPRGTQQGVAPDFGALFRRVRTNAERHEPVRGTDGRVRRASRLTRHNSARGASPEHRAASRRAGDHPRLSRLAAGMRCLVLFARTRRISRLQRDPSRQSHVRRNRIAVGRGVPDPESVERAAYRPRRVGCDSGMRG